MKPGARKWIERILNYLSIAFVVYIAYAGVAYFTESGAHASPQAVTESKEHVNLKKYLPQVDFSANERTAVLVLRSDCHYCQASIPFHRQLNDLATARRGAIGLVAVFAEPASQARSALRLEGLPIQNLQTSDLYDIGVVGTPTLLVVNRDGDLLGRFEGLLTAEKRRSALAMIGAPNAGGDHSDTDDEKLQDHPVASVAQGLSSSLVNAVQAAQLTKEVDNVQFVDIRDRKDFAISHLNGAINIPHDELEARLSHEVDPSRPVLLYCTYFSKCEEEYRAKGVLTGCTIALFSVQSAGLPTAKLITEDLDKLSSAGLTIVRTTPAISKR